MRAIIHSILLLLPVWALAMDSEALKGLIQSQQHAIVTLRTESSYTYRGNGQEQVHTSVKDGTGVVISADGLIVTGGPSVGSWGRRSNGRSISMGLGGMLRMGSGKAPAVKVSLLKQDGSKLAMTHLGQDPVTGLSFYNSPECKSQPDDPRYIELPNEEVLPALLDEVAILGRLGGTLGNQPTLRIARVSALLQNIKGAQSALPLLELSSQSMRQGGALFSAEGAALGILHVRNVRDAEQTRGQTIAVLVGLADITAARERAAEALQAQGEKAVEEPRPSDGGEF